MKQEHELTILALRGEQDRIRRLVERVDERIDTLAGQFHLDESRPVEPLHIAPIFRSPTAEPDVPIAVAPLIEEAKQTPAEVLNKEPVPAVTVDVAKRECVEPPPVEQVSEVPKSFPIPPVPPENHRPALEECHAEESFEVTFGRVWLARIGIVILLTGLVFLGNLAYQNIVPRLGAGAKLSLIVVAGMALGGIGAWLERAREGMRNYARVLIAGACATVYYATYAAHFVQPLRVIESPILGGALLLGLAGGIGWIAHRKKSEALAVLAVLLSYYTSGLNPIGGFTLFSSLLLTATAIFFLIKHRWVKLTFVSLVGTYVSYAWTRHFAAPFVADSLATQLSFLGGYWLLFTTGGFFARSLSKGSRLSFLTLNNAAFFAHAALELSRAGTGGFWILALSLGGVILALSVVARRMHSNEAGLASGLFVQGLALTTLGLASRLTGQQFALILAAQSVVLLFAGEHQRRLRVAASMLSIGGAAVLTCDGLIMLAPHSVLTAGIVVLVMWIDAWVVKRRVGDFGADQSHPLALTLTLASTILAVGCIARATDSVEMVTWFALGSLGFALLSRVLHFRELTLAGQAYLPIAAILWMVGMAFRVTFPPHVPAVVIGSGAVLSVWWARQSRLGVGDRLKVFLEGCPAFFASAVACCWLISRFDHSKLVLVMAAASPLWIILAQFLRGGLLAFSGLSFAIVSTIGFFTQQHELSWSVALAPIGSMLAVSTLSKFGSRKGRMPQGAEISQVGVGVAGVMTFLWIFTHIPADWQSLFFASVGTAATLVGAYRQTKELGVAGAALSGIGWALAVFSFQTAPTWQQLAAIILFPAGCRVARKVFAEEITRAFTKHLSWATMVGLTIWVLRWTNLHDYSTSRTILWTLLGLSFSGVGLVLRDREYRLGGLIVLCVAIARVFFVDVWVFDPVFRILTFILLGVVLLVVGYFYNRFAEKLKQWI